MKKIVMGLLSMFLMSACGAKKYKVDYNGEKNFYQNAKDTYKAGEKVEVIFDFIASDCDYSFDVEGADATITSENNGFLISFIMPENDVSITYDYVNTMEYVREERDIDVVLENIDALLAVGYLGRIESREELDDLLELYGQRYSFVEDINDRIIYDDFEGVASLVFVLLPKGGSKLIVEHYEEGSEEALYSLFEEETETASPLVLICQDQLGRSDERVTVETADEKIEWFPKVDVENETLILDETEKIADIEDLDLAVIYCD